MRILITGASGFIGRHLTRAAQKRGHDVIALSRSGQKVPGAQENIRWALTDPLPVFAKPATVAVHLAHDFDGEDGAQRTHQGTRQLRKELFSAGTNFMFYVSSFSSGPHARSLYGRTKAAIEMELSSDPRNVFVRPGLVLGDSGIFAKLADVAQRFPVVPLPDGGKGVVPVIEIDRLCSEMIDLCEMTNPPSEANLFHSELLSLKQLVQQCAQDAGKNPFYVNVPSVLVLPILRCIEALGFRAPITSDSLIGFIQNQKATHISTLKD